MTAPNQNFFRQHPVAGAGFIGATGVAGIAGISEFHRDSDLPGEERLSRSSSAAARGGLAAASVVALGYGAYKYGGGPAKSTGRFFQRQARAATSRLASDRYALEALVSRGPEHTAHLESLGLKPMSRARVAVEAYGRNTRLMAAGGAGAGLLIGAAYGHPVVGAVAGAGVGLAGKVGLGALDTWKKAGKVPGLRTAGVLAASTLLFAGLEAASPGDYQGVSYAVSDGTGAYDYSAEPSVRDRMASMRASGDLVLGLNRGRHG